MIKVLLTQINCNFCELESVFFLVFEQEGSGNVRGLESLDENC